MGEVIQLRNRFITPEEFELIKKTKIEGPNGWLLFVACNSGLALADRVKREYEQLLATHESSLSEIPLLNNDLAPSCGRKVTKVFEDGETNPRFPYHVAGSNAFVFQSVHEAQSGNSPNENLMQLFQIIRALRVNGARTITAVTPYSPYSRQDKPTSFKREATLAKLVADFFITAGANGVLVYHPHSECIRGFYEPKVRFTSLNGLDLFIEIMKERFSAEEEVSCVSTDAGGTKFTIYLAGALKVDYALASKYRPKQEQADLIGIIGMSPKKRVAIIGDDESVTVSSLENVARELSRKYNIGNIYMLVSHSKIKLPYIPRLNDLYENYGLKELHITDTIPQREELLKLPFVKVHSIGERLASTINRLHYDKSVSELFYRPKDD